MHRRLVGSMLWAELAILASLVLPGSSMGATSP